MVQSLKGSHKILKLHQERNQDLNPLLLDIDMPSCQHFPIPSGHPAYYAEIAGERLFLNFVIKSVKNEKEN